MKGRHFSSSPQRERKNASSSSSTSSSTNAPSTSSNKKGFSFVSSPTFQGDNKLGYSSAVRSILIGVPPSNQEIEDFIFSTEEYIERERHTKTMSPEALIVMEDAKRLLKDIRLFIDSKNQNEEFQHLLIKCQRITERLKERLDKERHNLNLGFSDSLKTLEGISSDVSHLGKNLIISGEFRKLLFEGFKTLQLLINLLTDRWIEKHKEPLQESSSTSFDYYDLNKNDHDDDFNDHDNDFDHHDKNKDKIKDRKDRRKQRKIQRQKQNYIKGNPTFDHQLDELTEKTIAILSLMKENPEYHRAVRGIFHLMKNFRAQRQLVQNDFIKSIHDELEDVRNLAIAILNHFVKKPHFVDHLVEKINDWFKFISEDPEISHFIENTESLIHFLLERPETIDHRIVREHIRTAKNLFIKKEQRELHHLSSIIIRDLLRLFEMIRTDEDVIRIAMGIERLIDDFLVKTVNSNQRKFKFDWALLGEIKSLLIPMILENLKEIYIPRMEFSSGNYDFIAEDIHISALSLLPENIHIEWYNGVDLGFRRRNNWGGSKTSSSSSTSSSINQHYADPFFHYSSSSSNHQHPIYQHHQQQQHHQVPISSKNQQPSSSSSSSQNRNYYYQDVDRPEYDHRHNLSFFDQHHPHHPHQQQQQHYQQSHPHQPYYPHQQQQQQQQHIHHSNEPSRWSYDDPRTRSIKENCPPIHPDTANSLLRIRIFHLTTRIENIHFWFRHRTTPVWEDYGIMDLILGGEGLFISIVLQGYSDNKDYTDGPYLPHHRMGEKRSFLGVRNVFVDIDDLVIRFRDTKHDLLYSLITSVLKPMIISRLETIISQKVTELLSGSYNNISNFWHRLKDELSQWIASNILPFDKKSSSTFDPFNKNQFSFSTSSSTSVSSFTGASSKKKNLKQKKQSGKSKKIASKDQYHESDEEQEEKYHEEDRESDRESDSSIDDNDSSDSESEDSSETTTENSSSSGSSSESEDDDENDDGFPQSYTVTPQDTPKMTSKKTPKNLHDDSLNINNDNDNDNDQQRKEREKSYLKRNRYPKTWEAQNLHSQSQSQSQSHPQPVSVIVTDTSNLLSPKIKTMKSNDRIIDDNVNNSNISSFNQETSSSSSILSSSSKNIEKEREKKEERRKNKQQSKHNESNKIQNKDEEFETIKLNETSSSSSSSSVNPESSTTSSSTSSSSQNEKKDNDENFDFDHHHLETKSFEGSSKDVLSPTTTLLPSMMRSRQRNLKIPRGIDQINEKEKSTQRTNTPQVQKQKQQLQPQEEHQHQRQRHNIDNDDDDEEQELEAGGSMDEEERIMTKQKVKRPTVSSTHKTNHRFVNSPILSRKSPTTMQRTSPLIRNPVLGNSPSPIRAPSPSVARASSPSIARASSPSLARASSAPSPSPSPSPSPNSSNSSLTSSNPNSSSSSSSSMRKGIVLGNFYPSTPPPSPLNFSQEVRAKNFQGSVSPDPFTSFVSE